MLTVTRKEQLLDAFRTAGLRGLTAREMEVLVGAFWKLRLRELRDDGCVFLEHRARFGRPGTFRWVLVLEPAVDQAHDGVEDRLLEPPVPPPGNAIHGDA